MKPKEIKKLFEIINRGLYPNFLICKISPKMKLFISKENNDNFDEIFEQLLGEILEKRK